MYAQLARRVGGEPRAEETLQELSSHLGLRLDARDPVLVATALIKTGVPAETVSSSLTWSEFETFCARLLEASGYTVRRGIVITKPRRQIDLLAWDQLMALSVDCKHWARGFGGSQLEKIARDQAERTVLYKQKTGFDKPTLPVIFTMTEPVGRLVRGVPVVPVFALRDFLSSVNRFDPEFDIV